MRLSCRCRGDRPATIAMTSSFSSNAVFGFLLALQITVRLSAARGIHRVYSSDGLTRHIVNVGDNLRLLCNVDATTDGRGGTGSTGNRDGGLAAQGYLVTWLKDGDEVTVGWERYKNKQDSLQVRPVELEDTGVYICRATNGFGTVEVRHLVYVIPPGNGSVLPPNDFDEEFIMNLNGRGEAPIFNTATNEHEYIVLPPGGTTRLSCHANGRPKPEVRWFKDGRPIERVDGGVGWPALALDDVSSQNAGRYTCQVSNRFGSISRNFTVEISDANSPDGAPAFQSTSSENVTVNAGETAVLICRVFSQSRATIEWMRRYDNDEILLPTRRGDGVTQPEDGGDRNYVSRMTIHGASPEDSGEYLCKAINDLGVSRRNVYLHVRPAAAVPGRGGSSSIKTTDVDQSFGDAQSANGERGMSVITPVSAVCIGLVVLIIIIVVAVVVCRRNGHCRSGGSQSGSIDKPVPQTKTVTARPAQPVPAFVGNQQQQQPGRGVGYQAVPNGAVPDEQQWLQWQHQQAMMARNGGNGAVAIPLSPPQHQQQHWVTGPDATATWCRQQQQQQQQQQQWHRPPPQGAFSPAAPTTTTSLQSSPMPHQPLLMPTQQPPQHLQQMAAGVAPPGDEMTEFRVYEEC